MKQVPGIDFSSSQKLAMSQIARNPFAQPTAISVAESQVTQVHRVFGGRAWNEV